MQKKLLLVIVILGVPCCFVLGQPSGPDWNLIRYSYIHNNFKLPASPGAASFTRYDNNYSVSYYTGAANIQIPLTEIGDGALSFPVSLNYSTSGIKVDDLPGWAGLGWNISAGGAITRTVRGHPDMIFNYFNANSNWPNESASNTDQIAERLFLDKVAQGDIETQPDVYNFNFGPYSGSFVIKKDYGYLFETEQYLTPCNNCGGEFAFIDAAGFKYIFNAPETTTYHFETVSGDGPSFLFDFKSAWYLTEIQHPNPAEGKIVLEYITIPGFQDKLVGLESLKTYHYSFEAPCCGSGSGFSTGEFTQQQINNRRIISKISFHKANTKWQELVFTTSPNSAPHSFNSYKIDKIQKFDYTDGQSPQKTIDFAYNTSTNRLTLGSVTETGRNSLAMPSYVFEYESGTLPTPFDMGVDFWGYSNGSCCGLIHSWCGIPGGGGNTNRLASFSAGKTGTLNKVIYPTGGYTKYIYEAHSLAPFTITSAACEPNHTQAGGVRIKQIEHYTKDNVLVGKREYKYLKENGTESSGLLLNSVEFARVNSFHHEPTFNCITGECVDAGSDYYCNSVTLVPNAVQSNEYFEKGHVGYSRVEEIISSTNSSATAGKTVFEFINDLYGNGNYRRNGDLKTKSVYDASGNILEKNTFTYYLDNNNPTTNTYKRLWADPETQSNYTRLCYTGTGYIWLLPFNCPVCPNCCVQSQLFETRFIRRTRSFKTLLNYLTSEQTIKYVYESGIQKAITSTVNYEYNYAYALVPTKISTTNSDNKLHEIRYIYPNATNQPLLFDKYMRSSPVEVEKYVAGAKVYGYKTIYANFGTNLKPSVVQEAFGTGSYTNSEEMLAYDAAGNILEAKRTHDQENAYIWWNSPMYLSAFVQNAKQSEVLYASFEMPTTNDGGWTTNTTYFQYASNAGAAGNCYYMGATSLVQNKLVPTGTYILSYFTSSSSGATYTGGTLLSQKISAQMANGMYLVQAVMSLSSSTALQLNFSAATKIDEVRLYPHDALMQTFSYDKKSGLLLSICDPSGMPARFEYDGLNRLIGVLNMDNHYVQTNEYNYANTTFFYNAIVNRNVLISGQTTQAAVAALTGANVVRAFNYFDGLGRPVQQVLLDQAPNSDDIVKFNKYDNFGRERYDMLPSNITASNTAWNTVFRTSAATEQSSFWNTLYSGQGAYAQAEKTLESSPLSRELETKPPGQAFSAHPVLTSYLTNAVNEVRNFFIASQYYAEKTLYKTKVLDENGRYTYVYIDYLGRKIMEDAEGFKTYYLYNDAGLLAQVIQPEGAKLGHSTPSLTNTSASVSCHSFLYTYDAEYRLATKSVPGTSGTYQFFYDRLDRKVLEMDNKGFKTFYKYDILGRLILSGRYTGATNTPSGSEQLYENKSTIGHYYTTNLSFPTASCDVYTVTYFDGYNFNNDAAYTDDISYQATPSAGMTYPGAFSANHPSNLTHLLVRGKATSSKTGLLNSSQSAPTIFVQQYTFYDKFSRPLQAKTVHPYGGADIGWIKYNFVGWVEVMSKEHQATLGGSAKKLFLTNRYTYDQAGRKLNTYHQINNNAEVILSSQQYNALSQLQQKKLGTDAASPLQTVDFKYNIRGWLSDINDVAACNNDVFSLKLNYEVGNTNLNAAAQWNGNISFIEWRTGVNCQVGGVTRNKAFYGFTYDAHDRLTQAKYAEIVGLYTNIDNYNETLTYNDNGDILTLQRRGKNGATFGVIDNLTYSYTTTGAMRLSSINETGVLTLGYKATAAASAWTHDNNGNVTARTNVNVTGIGYNHLNLPDYFTTPGGAEILNTYDAAGRKWYSNAGGTVATHYFGEIEYENNNLQAIYHEDGRIVPLSGTTYEYHFYLKDHLGNVRTVVKGTGAAPVLMQEYHYYPFGMAMDGNWATPQGLDQKYLYNGKELVDDLGLNWYDYGARWYDASVGRWMQVDPLAEAMSSWSPYNYVAGNPVKLIDPDGMFGVDYQSVRRERDAKMEEHRTEANAQANQALFIREIENIAKGEGNQPQQQDPEDKEKLKASLDKARTIWQFTEENQGKSKDKITTQMPKRQGFAGGPASRYVKDPLHPDDVVLDMRHLLIIGEHGVTVGKILEWVQGVGDKNSADNPQDYYSNALGAGFYRYMRNMEDKYELNGVMICNNCADLYGANYTEHLQTFLTSVDLRNKYVPKDKYYDMMNER